MDCNNRVPNFVLSQGILYRPFTFQTLATLRFRSMAPLASNFVLYYRGDISPQYIGQILWSMGEMHLPYGAGKLFWETSALPLGGRKCAATFPHHSFRLDRALPHLTMSGLIKKTNYRRCERNSGPTSSIQIR